MTFVLCSYHHEIKCQPNGAHTCQPSWFVIIWSCDNSFFIGLSSIFMTATRMKRLKPTMCWSVSWYILMALGFLWLTGLNPISMNRSQMYAIIFNCWVLDSFQKISVKQAWVLLTPGQLHKIYYFNHVEHEHLIQLKLLAFSIAATPVRKMQNKKLPGSSSEKVSSYQAYCDTQTELNRRNDSLLGLVFSFK